MNPHLRKFLDGFSFKIQYRTLRYMAVCAFALAGAVTAAWASGGEVTWVILAGAGCYIAGRLVLWIMYRE